MESSAKGRTSVATGRARATPTELRSVGFSSAAVVGAAARQAAGRLAAEPGLSLASRLQQRTNAQYRLGIRRLVQLVDQLCKGLALCRRGAAVRAQVHQRHQF